MNEAEKVEEAEKADETKQPHQSEAKQPDESEFFSAKPAISPFNATRKDKELGEGNEGNTDGNFEDVKANIKAAETFEERPPDDDDESNQSPAPKQPQKLDGELNPIQEEDHDKIEVMERSQSIVDIQINPKSPSPG